jgi:hypothetical protein
VRLSENIKVDYTKEMANLDQQMIFLPYFLRLYYYVFLIWVNDGEIDFKENLQ